MLGESSTFKSRWNIHVKCIQMLWHAHLLILPLTHSVESMQLSKASSWQQVAFESTSSKLLSSVLFRNCPVGIRFSLDFDYHLVFCNFILSVGLWRFDRMPQKYSTPSYACPSRSRFLAKIAFFKRCQGRGKTHTHTHKSSRLPKGCEQETTPEKSHHPKTPKKGYVTNHNRWLRVAFHHRTSQQHDSHDDTDDDKPVSWWHPPWLQTINDVSRHRYGWRRLTLESLQTSQPWVPMITASTAVPNIFWWVAKEHHILEISGCLQYQCALYMYIYFQFHSLNLSMVTLFLTITRINRWLFPKEIIILWSSWHLKINEHLPNQPTNTTPRFFKSQPAMIF